jgi:hypothetical protein
MLFVTPLTPIKFSTAFSAVKHWYPQLIAYPASCIPDGLLYPRIPDRLREGDKLLIGQL